MKQLISSLVLVILASLTYSCKQKSDSFEKPMINEAIGRYISSYTSGFISRNEFITIRFNQDIELAIAENKKQPWFEITPSVDGSLIWEDARTLVFRPSEKFKSDSRFQVSINLKQLIPDIEKEAEKMVFHLQTRKQDVQISIENIIPISDNKPDRVRINGIVNSSDVLSSEELNESFSFSLQNKNISVSWNSTSNQLTHFFEIDEMERGSNKEKLEIKFNKKPSSAVEDRQLSFDLSIFDNFTVFDAKPVFSDEPHLLVLFTRRLDQRQEFKGLIQLIGTNTLPKMMVEDNLLRIYPGSVQGDQLSLQIESAVRSITGAVLGQTLKYNFNWIEYKPQVRIAGRGNIISEDAQGVILPVEVMGLKALDIEIFQIFSDNILQFLQTADQNLDGYEMTRVGRIVARKKIQLDGASAQSSSTGWSRYGLNLLDIIDFDPKSIYQIRFSFRPEYTALSCSQSLAVPQNIDYNSGNEYFEDDDYEFSPFSDYYGIYGYFDEYNWNNRENPCFPEYYNRSKFASRTVISSSIGLMAKKLSRDEWSILATHIGTGAPAASVKIKVFDYQQQLLAEGQTDNSGQVSLNCASEPFVIQAELNGKQSYLRIKGNQSLQLSRFDVDGVAPVDGMKGFIYAERAVWRPGDSMFFNLILEGAADRNLPVTAELTDPLGKLYKKIQAGKRSGNMYALHTATAPEDKTGNWLLTVKVGPAVFKKSIRVETIKPNRLKVTYDPLMKSIGFSDKSMAGTIQSNWLHGAPVADLKTDIQLSLRKQKTQFKGYEKYNFDDPSRSVNIDPLLIFRGTLDEQGSTPVKFDMPGNMTPSGKMIADFRVRVFEKGGDFSVDYFSMEYSPYPSYTGVSIPKDKYSQNRLEVGQGQPIELLVLNEQGKPLPGKQLSVGLYKVNWRWWWENYGDFVDGFSSSQHEEAVLSEFLVSDSQGRIKWLVNIEDWGRYLVRICDRQGGHCSGDFFYAGYPWYDDESITYSESAILELSTDKKTYNTGEEIQLRVPAPENSNILVSIENGTTVIQSSWHKAESGENLIKIRSTDKMTPNVYLNVSVIQGNQYRNPSFPMRMYGVVPVMISNPDNQLLPEISMAETIRGGEPFRIEVREKNGKPMSYTLAVVDEGLLDITRFPTPDPYAAFFAKEALGVRTWDLYDQILASAGVESGRLLSIGGDGYAVRIEGAPKANRFKPVVLHTGPFYLENGKRAKHDFVMPEYAGSVRVMLIASDEKKYGHVQKTVSVKQDLMVLSSAPRVIRPGESFELLLNLFALDKKVENVKIEVKEKSGLASFPDGNTQSVSFKGKAETTSSMSVKIKEQTGSLFFDITVSGNGQKAETRLEMEVLHSNPIQRQVQNIVLDASSAKELNAKMTGISGSNKLYLELSVFPALNLGGNLQYLLQYPHGCLEQITSAALAQVALGKVVPLSDEAQAKVFRQVNGVINKLRSYQRTDGSFSYWPGGTESNQWITNYVGYFLLQAKANGYSVPEITLNKWQEYQRNLASKWSPSQSKAGLYPADDHLNQSMRLFTLAFAGKPDFGAMNRFRETAEKYTESSWLLAAAYGLSGRRSTGNEIVKNISTKVSENKGFGSTLGSDLRNKAIILDACTILKLNKEADALAFEIAGMLNKPDFLNTHSIAYGILAVSRYLTENPPSDRIVAQVIHQGQKPIRIDQTLPVFSLELKESDLSSSPVIKLENIGNGKLYVQAVTEGRPASGKETSSSSNLQMSVRYLDSSRQEINPESLTQGQDFLAEVTVATEGAWGADYRYLALNQVFPAGWEIIGKPPGGQIQNKQANLSYQDVRDDRVLSYFDLGKNRNSQTIVVELTAAYKGKYYLPALSCESMYDPNIYAQLPGKWVEVK